MLSLPFLLERRLMAFIDVVRLQDVNRLLRTAGLMTIDSIDITMPDIEIAVDTLETVDREMQSEGWYFNTEFQYTITRDVNDELVLPTNYLDARMSTNKWTARGLKLYDLENHTFTLAADEDDDIVIQEIILLIDHVDAPVVYQNAMLAEAAARFFTEIDGDQLIARTLMQKAQSTKFVLRQRDLQRKHVNGLNNSAAAKLLYKYPTTNIGGNSAIIGGSEWLLTQ